MGNAMYRKQATNKEYQSWTGYPDSPYLYSVFPYQTILNTYGLINLIVSVRPFYRDGSLVVDGDVFEGVYYDDITHAWGTATDHYSARNVNSFIESNHNIYTDATLMSVDFAKTTTTEQDAGTTASLIRIRNLHHKDGASLIRDKAAFWLERSANLNYQKWTGYPDSPELISELPFQAIVDDLSGNMKMLLSGYPIYTQYSGNPYYLHTWTGTGDATFHLYILTGGVWEFVASNFTEFTACDAIIESNNDVYNETGFTSIYFSKTTTPSQDAGISEILHRINI